MEEALSLLASSELFAQVSREDFVPLLRWLAPTEHRYKKGEIVLLAGYPVRELGFLLEGELEGVKPTADGRQLTVGHFAPGGVFGDVLAFGGKESPVTITALQDSRVLYLPASSLLRPGCPVPAAQTAFVANLLAAVSDKYFELDRRLDLLLIKSLRSRICAFLLEESRLAGSATFRIRLTRSQLAQYLCCDRSALCRELSRMKAEGLLETYRGSFRLLQPHRLRCCGPDTGLCPHS